MILSCRRPSGPDKVVSEQSIHRDRAPSVPPHRLRFLAIFPISGDSVPLPQRFPTLPSGELDPSGVLPSSTPPITASSTPPPHPPSSLASPPPPPRSSGRRRRHPSRSPFPTTSPPHAGSRAPQPVHAPEPPSQSPLRGLRQALFDPQVAASRGRRRAMLLTPEFLPAATLVADALSCIRAIHAYSKPIISVQIW